MTSAASSTPLPFAQRILSSRLAWFLLGIAVLLSILGDIRNTLLFGGVDLRDRVVGARLMAAGKNPYTRFWQTGDPEEYFDPQALPGRPANRISVTPATLAWHMLFSGWHYRTVKWVWLAVQWICFAAMTAALVYATPRSKRRLVLMALLAVCACGEVWRMHVERGHVYVSYALLWAVAFALSQGKARAAELGCGFMLGVAAVLRPTCALVSLPFLLSRRWLLLAGVAAGAASCLAAAWPWADAEVWRSYAVHMHDIGQYYLHDGTIPPQWRYPQTIPATVEGIRDPAAYRDFGISGTDLHVRAARLLPVSLRGMSLTAAFLAFLAVYLWRLARHWRPRRSVTTGLLAGMVLAIAADFFIPVSRTMYNNILWAVPMSVLLSREPRGELLRGGWGILLGVALVLANGALPCAQYDVLRLSDYLLLGLMTALSLRMAAADGTTGTGAR